MVARNAPRRGCAAAAAVLLLLYHRCVRHMIKLRPFVDQMTPVLEILGKGGGGGPISFAVGIGEVVNVLAAKEDHLVREGHLGCDGIGCRRNPRI